MKPSRRSLQKHFVHTESDAVVLIFRSQHPGETPWRSIEQRVPILWTACHLGGRRPWFRCTLYLNGQYCGRRVAVLFGAGDLPLRIKLRQPAGEPAKSIYQALANDQNAARWQSRRATVQPFPKRPRGMHQRTYMRLRARDPFASLTKKLTLHRSGRTARSIGFPAKRWAYSDVPSFSSRSTISCIFAD